MGLSLTLWMLPGLLGAAIAGVAAVTARARPSRPGARALLVLALGVGWWCLLQVVVIALPTLEGKMLASRLQYLGISLVPLAWLWFALAHTSRAETIPRAVWALIAAPEAATLLLAWTNGRHGLIWERAWLVPAGSFSSLRLQYGAWFQLHVYYAYALIGAGTLILLFALVQSRYHYPRAIAVVVASLLPIAGNLLYRLDWIPPQWVDLTPLGFALGGLVLTASSLRGSLLDLPPIARGRILDAIGDGVLVVDSGGRVLDLNPAAARLLGCRLGDTLPGALAGPFGAGDGAPDVVRLEERSLEVRRSAVREVSGDGGVVVVRDVTEQERLQRELEEVGDELVRANRELAVQASTDELTGLPNRRRFFQVLEDELRRAARYRHPLGLLLLDIDHFKQINDSLGHGAGDLVLCGIGETIENSLRDVDTVGRLGGDEFAIVLPETDAEGARATARRVLERISARAYHTPSGVELRATVSIGLVIAEQGERDAEALMHRADMALYEAKAAGRNRLRLTAAPE